MLLLKRGGRGLLLENSCGYQFYDLLTQNNKSRNIQDKL